MNDNMWFEPLYGLNRNNTFTYIYPDASKFVADYKDFNTGIIDNSISDTAATTLYYLLYARYGNSTIASSDENQFKYKLFSLIFMYGPSWEKRLEIQKAIRALAKVDESGNFVVSSELLRGGKAVYNSALNPAQPVLGDKGNATGEGMNTLNELTYINSQNTTNYQKSVPDAYAILWDMLKTDVTNDFLTKFRKLFLTVVSPENPLYYITKDPEDIDNGNN